MHGTIDIGVTSRADGAAEPIYIAGMFGWLHRPQPDFGGETAVLICSAINRDALDSHYFLHVLAGEFAAAGYPALRFDYPGAGDSADLDDFSAAGGNVWRGWQQGVQAAADYLLAATGAKRLIICGLRLGATLALLAAEKRPEISGLILLAPVIRGQSYIRQLWVESGLRQGQSAKLQEGFTFQDLSFSKDAVQSIAAVDLRAAKMPAGLNIAIFAQSPSAPLTACESAWTQQGAKLWSTDFRGLDPLLSRESCGEMPPPDFRQLLNWAEQNIPPRPHFQPASEPTADARWRRAGLTETPLRFGPGKDLFGMLCQSDSDESDIAVVLCTNGRNPHYGIGRGSVHLARNLANAGIASLRIDFAGQGDSAGPAARKFVMSDPFENRVPEIKAAIDRLTALGYRRFAVQGLCSAAFHAFHAALADTRIGMLLLVNFPLFEQSDDAGRELAVRAALPWYHYLKRLADKRARARLLSGRFDVAGILSGRLSRLRAKLGRLIQSKALDVPVNFARTATASLSRRGVRTLFLFGPDEVGFHGVEENFGPNGAGLAELHGVTLQVVGDFDHSMALPHSQKAAAHFMLDQLLAWRGNARIAATPHK